jgi:hypothetical protein
VNSIGSDFVAIGSGDDFVLRESSLEVVSSRGTADQPAGM